MLIRDNAKNERSTVLVADKLTQIPSMKSLTNVKSRESDSLSFSTYSGKTKRKKKTLRPTAEKSYSLRYIINDV